MGLGWDLGWDWDGVGMGLGWDWDRDWDWDGIGMEFLFPSFSSIFAIHPKTPKITGIYQKIMKILGSTKYFWERSIFGPKKRISATKSHLGWNTQVESNLAPLGFQAGGPTTRPDLHGLGDGTILANLGKIVGICEMVK